MMLNAALYIDLSLLCCLLTSITISHSCHLLQIQSMIPQYVVQIDVKSRCTYPDFSRERLPLIGGICLFLHVLQNPDIPPACNKKAHMQSSDRANQLIFDVLKCGIKHPKCGRDRKTIFIPYVIAHKFGRSVVENWLVEAIYMHQSCSPV